MAKTWKKMVTKAKNSTLYVFGKGKNLMSVQNHRNIISNYYGDIGRLVYQLYEKGNTNISLANKEIHTIIEDIEYRMKKIEDLLSK